ncbi:alkaline phosphatase family protein [Natronorarus salvus]|uniref:alkaline phosphatase family protein n=1 Tax=Natronorarus salvus TaxID=3117733 RepID=UPI002F266BF7
MNASLRALIVEIDGASPQLLDPMLDRGLLPTLSSLAETGASGPLRSQVPLHGTSAWSSLHTGTNPGKHGVFGPFVYEGYDWVHTDVNAPREPALWEILAYHGLSSTVVNVPFATSGESVAAVPAACPPASSVDEDLSAVREAIGEYRLSPEPGVEGAERALVDQRLAAFSHLLDVAAPDVGIVRFESPGRVNRGDADREQLYRAIDAGLGDLLERVDADLVVVASAYGLAQSCGHELRVNEFLHRRGYLESGPCRGKPATPTEAECVAEPIGSGPIDRVIGGTRRVLPRALLGRGSRSVDLAGSTAYLRSPVEYGLRVNRRGREPDGVVGADRYETLRSELIETLRDLTAPNGDPAFTDVVRREAYLWGPHVDEAPDVVAIPNEGVSLSAALGGEVFDSRGGTPCRTPTGYLAVAGPGIDPRTLSDAHLFDVAPTVLAALSLPLSDRMDGAPLPVAPRTGRMSYPQPATDAAIETDGGRR